MDTNRRIAYFSMEVGIRAEIPTYAGGLGILAGDTIRSAADLKVPMVAVTLLHRSGYFHQTLDESGTQTESPVDWRIDDYLETTSAMALVRLEGREVQLRAWLYEVRGDGSGGARGYTVPVVFIDADLPDNSEVDRALTHSLYGGDLRVRLCQEVILGAGGVRILRALGFDRIERYHMNEGHAALLAAELLREHLQETGKTTIDTEAVNSVRRRCVFTTHTPVPAGHDKFPMDLVHSVLGRHEAFEQSGLFDHEGMLNMTYAALNLSHYVNGVAKRHGEITRHMFAGYVIDSITNGVHAATWMAESFQTLYDERIPGWRDDNFNLRYALSIAPGDVWDAHTWAKHALISHVNRAANVGMDMNTLTIGFARRATTYKRPDLLFTDIKRLRAISSSAGPLQIMFAGKAHPHDEHGKRLIKQIIAAAHALRDDVKVVYLPNYDMSLARMLVGGVDVWLNTPHPPLEASGTSGMKAALNGVPSLSILDGWWIEGCIEGVTGWSIGEDAREAKTGEARPQDAASLYDKLERVIMPLFYNDRPAFIEVMRHAIALNGSFFNTHRMVQQYVLKAYFD